MLFLGLLACLLWFGLVGLVAWFAFVCFAVLCLLACLLAWFALFALFALLCNGMRCLTWSVSLGPAWLNSARLGLAWQLGSWHALDFESTCEACSLACS